MYHLNQLKRSLVAKHEMNWNLSRRLSSSRLKSFNFNDTISMVYFFKDKN